MCGRYVSSTPPDVLAGHYGAVVGDVVPRPPSWNVAPTSTVYVVVAHDVDGRPRRELRDMHWGLVPSWAPDRSIGTRQINARAETVSSRPAYRDALRRRRCVIPADGFYEWRVVAGRRQPFFISARDGTPLSFAGLYDTWRDPVAPDAAPLWSCAIVTTAANEDVAFLHDRMPVVLAPDAWPAWLDADADAESLLARPAPGRLVAHAVSTDVGSVQNDGPQLVAAVPYDEPLALFD